MIESATDPVPGRWATLKDAAGVLDTEPVDLLKQVKKGRRRATRIGNSWFVYLDAEVQAAAAERKRKERDRQALRKEALRQLEAENESLREELERTKAAAPDRPAPAGVGRDLAPLLEGIERHHRGMMAEIEFLRAELVATRQQHAEEMRRKDILLQQAHKTLQEVVKLGPPAQGAAQPAPALAGEVASLRENQERMSRVLGEMSQLLSVMYRRLR